METAVFRFEHDMPVRNYPAPRWTGDEYRALERAAELIRNGELVAFPTETVYGLGGNALDPEAAGKIYAAKGRPSDNPLIVHIADCFEFYRLCSEVPDEAMALAETFWPGPLTMVLPKSFKVPDVTTGGLGTVAIRMPNSAVAYELIQLSGVPIAAPSANLSGRPSPTRGDHCVRDLDGRIPMILWGEDCKVGIESTIVDLTEETPAVLRPGIITPTQLSKALGREVIIDPAILGVPDKDLRPRAPGMKYRHYAPKAPMTIFQGEPDDVRRRIETEKAKAEAEGLTAGVILFSDDAFEEAARNLFADLRKMDDEGVDRIFAGALKQSDERGFAVMNRMLKSAGYNVIDV
jgi:L-threonylcarbamoyladenylate synthase